MPLLAIWKSSVCCLFLFGAVEFPGVCGLILQVYHCRIMVGLRPGRILVYEILVYVTQAGHSQSD